MNSFPARQSDDTTSALSEEEIAEARSGMKLIGWMFAVFILEILLLGKLCVYLLQ